MELDSQHANDLVQFAELKITNDTGLWHIDECELCIAYELVTIVGLSVIERYLHKVFLRPNGEHGRLSPGRVMLT